MRRRIARFLSLPAPERVLLVHALFWLPATALALKIRGAGRQAFGAAPVSGSRARVSARRITALVAIASRNGLVRGNCLSQSMTLCRLLRRQGHGAQLRIGARRGAGGLEAHAWVEHEGCVLNDTADVAKRFAPFPAPTSPLPRLV